MRGLLIGVGVILAIGAVLVIFPPSGADDLTGVAQTEAWELPALDGEEPIALADFSGKPTVAAFFASWCPHCRRELPGFAALSRQLDDQVHFVGINTQDRGNGKRLAEQSGIDEWPLARDIGPGDQRELSTAFGARGMPLTVIYAPDGTVRDVNRGVLSASQLAAKLEAFFGVSA